MDDTALCFGSFPPCHVGVVVLDNVVKGSSEVSQDVLGRLGAVEFAHRPVVEFARVDALLSKNVNGGALGPTQKASIGVPDRTGTRHKHHLGFNHIFLHRQTVECLAQSHKGNGMAWFHGKKGLTRPVHPITHKQGLVGGKNRVFRKGRSGPSVHVGIDPPVPVHHQEPPQIDFHGTLGQDTMQQLL